MSFHARTLTDEAEILRLHDSWNRLREGQAHPRIGQHPDWLAAEVGAAATDGGRPLVAALYRDGELAGVAPFLLQNKPWPCRLGYRTVAEFPVRWAVFLGERLLAPAEPRAQEALLAAVADAASQFQVVYLESLPTDSLLWKRLRTSPTINGRFWVYQPWEVTTHRSANLPPTFDEYLARQFSSDSRKKLRKWERKLNEAAGGDVRLQRITAPEEVPEFLGHVERVSSRSWQGTQLGKVIRAEERLLGQYAAYARQGWMRSYLLWAAGNPVAFQIGYLADGVYYCDQTGYDPDWAAYRPGTMMIYQYLQDLYREGRPGVIDFGYGENEYKRFFGNDVFEEATVYLVAKSPANGIAMGCHWACSRATTLVRRALENLGWKEKVRRRLRGRADRLPALSPVPPHDAPSPANTAVGTS